MKKAALLFGIANILFCAMPFAVRADTQSDIDAYVEDLNAGNFANAEKKILVALKNATEKYGPMHANTISISYDLADIYLLQNKSKDALSIIESIKANLKSKPELEKAMDIDSLNFLYGLSLAANISNQKDRDLAANLLKAAAKTFDGQERSDAYLLNAYQFLSQYSYDSEDFGAQIYYSDKSINEIKRLFPNGNSMGSQLLAAAYLSKSMAVFTDGFKKFGFDGMDEKTGKSLGNNALKSIGNYDFLLEAAKLNNESLKAYGSPKSKSDTAFYKSATWGTLLYSYFSTLKTSGYKIKSPELIKSALGNQYGLQKKLDIYSDYDCEKYLKKFDKSEFILDSSNHYDFGAAYLRFDINQEGRPINVIILGSLPSPIYGEKLKEKLEKFSSATAKADMPQSCKKDFLYDWNFSTDGFTTPRAPN